MFTVGIILLRHTDGAVLKDDSERKWKEILESAVKERKNDTHLTIRREDYQQKRQPKVAVFMVLG